MAKEAFKLKKSSYLHEPKTAQKELKYESKEVGLNYGEASGIN